MGSRPAARTSAIRRRARWGLPAAIALFAAATLALPAVASAQQLDVADDSVFEDPGAEIFFDINRGAPTGGTTTAQYTVSPGTAMFGSDYTGPIVDDDATPGDGVATFPPGDTQVRVTVPLVNDNLFEPDENLFLDLGTIVNGLRGDDHGVGVIHDSDPDSPYWAAVLGDNPAHYFRMDDAGPTVMDNETAGADGTHMSDPIFGVNGALMSETPNLSVGYQDPDVDRSTFGVAAHDAFTLEFWTFILEPDPAADDDLWYEGKGLVDGDISGPAQDSGVALVRNGHVGFGLGNTDTMIESTTAVNDGAWHHVAATSDGNGAMRLYVDGASEAQTLAGPTANRANTSFTIGALNFPFGGTTGELSGFMDEVAFYPHALTPTDVNEHYHAAQGAQSVSQIRFSVIGDGFIAGPGISCRQGGAGCLSSELLGATRDFTAFPDSGHRLGTSSFTGDCIRITASQCRVVADKSVESSQITFFPEPVTAGTDLSKGIHAVGDAIGKGLGAALGGKKPKPPPLTVPLPPRPDVGLGDLGAGVVVTLLPKNGGLISKLTPPSLIGECASCVVGQNGASVIGQNGASVIGQNGASSEMLGKVRIPVIGQNGASFMSATGGGDATVAGKRKGKKPKTLSYLLGRYSAVMDGEGQVQPVFGLTQVGRQLIRRIGKLNRKGKKIVPKATVLEVFQPQDKGKSGGTYAQFKIK